MACAKQRLQCTYTRVAQICGEIGYEQHQQQANFVKLSTEDQQLTAPTALDPFALIDVVEDAEPWNSQILAALTVQEVPPVTMSSTDRSSNDSFDPYTLPASCLQNQEMSRGLLFPRPTDLDVYALKSFPFLSKMASLEGLGNIFECGNALQRSAIACNIDSASTCHFEDPGTAPYAFNWLDLNFDDIPSENSHPGANAAAELFNASEKVISVISQGTMCDQSACKRGRLKRASLERACRTIFTPQNLQRYLSLYWSCWHPNWPVMHKSTFSVNTTSPVLLAAMVVIGACLSTMPEDCTLAGVVFDAIEDAVFSNEVFSSDLTPASEHCSDFKGHMDQLEILLAAYCVCLYQTWEGSKIAKRRVRRERYNQIICVGASLCSPGILTLRYPAGP